MANTDYDFYNSQLAAQGVVKPGTKIPPPREVTPGQPQPGWYRTRSNVGVVIWRADSGALLAEEISADGSTTRRIEDADRIDALFSVVCRRAVRGQVFREFILNQTWPEDIEEPAPRGIGDNSGAPPPPAHEGLRGQVNDLLDAGLAWLKSIGGKVFTKEQVDKAANYADRFARYEKEAKESFAERKKPILEEAKRIDATWKPVIEAADDAKRQFKALCTDYLRAVAAKAEAEELKARQEAKEKNELFQTRPSVAVAGTSGGNKVALRTYKEAVVTDWKALAQHFLTMEELPTDVKDGLLKAAKPIVLAGGTIPGVQLKKEKRAA